MYSLLKYITGSKTKNQDESQLQTSTSNSEVVKKYTRNSKVTLFLVVEKGTQNPLGIYDSLELAKENGQKITYYNCMIIPFVVNDPCKYLFKPVFENR